MKPGFIVATVAVALALGLGLFLNSGPSEAPQTSFVLLDGAKKSTSDMKGKVTLVNFWATSCTTCVAEMPKIIATHDKYKSKGFDTLAVAMSYDHQATWLIFHKQEICPSAWQLTTRATWPRLGAMCN